MDPRSPFAPYVAPAAPSVIAAGSSPALNLRIIGRAFLVSALWSAIVGASLATRFTPGLRVFGGIEFVPRIIALAVTREQAQRIAFLVCGLTAVRIVHRASRKAPAMMVERSLGLSLGVVMLLLYAANVASSLVAAATLLRIVYDLPFAVFASEARKVLTPNDFLFGQATTAAYAVLTALIARPALRLVASSRRGLFWHLVVAAVALYAASLVIAWALAAALG